MIISEKIQQGFKLKNSTYGPWHSVYSNMISSYSIVTYCIKSLLNWNKFTCLQQSYGVWHKYFLWKAFLDLVKLRSIIQSWLERWYLRTEMFFLPVEAVQKWHHPIWGLSGPPPPLGRLNHFLKYPHPPYLKVMWF